MKFRFRLPWERASWTLAGSQDLCAQGFGWKKIASEMGVEVGTLYRFATDGSKIREKDFGMQ